MVELSKKRIEEILNEETAKTEELPTILRGVYTRYMCLFEKYFADIDALNDEKVAEFRKHHEETKSLIKYYYMDIPLDICAGLEAFEKEYCDNLLGTKWHDYLYSYYKDFRKKSNDEKKGSKEEFSKQTLSNFYDEMDYFQRWFRYGKQERRGDKKWSFGAAVWGRRVIRKGAYGSDY